MGQLIRVNPRILNRGQCKKMQLEEGSCKEWAITIRSKRKDSLSKDAVNLISMQKFVISLSMYLDL
jgi:hypothetical protein